MWCNQTNKKQFLEEDIGMAEEVYYCGHCRRQQQPSEGIPCKVCGKRTVSWDTDRESEADVKKKWHHING